MREREGGGVGGERLRGVLVVCGDSPFMLRGVGVVVGWYGVVWTFCCLCRDYMFCVVETRPLFLHCTQCIGIENGSLTFSVCVCVCLEVYPEILGALIVPLKCIFSTAPYLQLLRGSISL